MEAQGKAKSVVEHIARQIFKVYSNFLSEEARQPWNKIFYSPWRDLRGVDYNIPRSKTWDSFRERVTFHMLMVFQNNAMNITLLIASRNPTEFPSGSSCSACSS